MTLFMVQVAYERVNILHNALVNEHNRKERAIMQKLEKEAEDKQAARLASLRQNVSVIGAVPSAPFASQRHHFAMSI